MHARPKNRASIADAAMPVVRVLLLGAAAAAAAAPPAPTVYSDARFAVEAQLGVPYAMGVLCDPKPCKQAAAVELGPAASAGGYDCSVCQQPEPEGSAPIPPSTGCASPRLFNLTLDLYRPVGVPASLGPRPAFVATHEGGYASGTEQGCLLSGLPVDPARPASGPYGGHEGEMTATCRHFAARGFVCVTMTYRLTNSQTGGALAPSNWSGVPSPLNRSWQGGFHPKPQAIYPAVRDTKAAIRWLRGHAAQLNIAKGHFGAGGWSAGACTTVFLATQREADFTHEMNPKTDPTFGSLSPFIAESASIQAGVVWAGNAVVADTIDAMDAASGSRYSSSNAPLAMYRGSDDGTMTPWAQAEVQKRFNSSGVLCDLFTAPNATHSGLFPTPVVGLKNGGQLPLPLKPVLNHSYDWITTAMKLKLAAKSDDLDMPETSIMVDMSGVASSAYSYDGHGGIADAGSSRLLMDYPEPQRSHILDYLFLPSFGASLHTLKVEVAGDVQSGIGCVCTCTPRMPRRDPPALFMRAHARSLSSPGCQLFQQFSSCASASKFSTGPSHMHHRHDLACERGNVAWLVREVKKRNPKAVIYGLPWGMPVRLFVLT